MTVNLLDKVAVVTGGSSGIGKGIVEAFVRSGASVVIADIDAEKSQQLVASLGSEKVAYIHTDVSKEDDVKACIDLAVERYAQLDCLVNNVGIPGTHASIEEISEQDFYRLMGIDLLSVILGMKHAVPIMKQQQAGSIINMSSTAGQMTGGITLYQAAKAAVDHLTRSIALEVGSSNIRVNAIAPGIVATPMYGLAYGVEVDDSTVEAIKDAIAGNQPIPRGGSMEDIAKTAVFLASDDSSFITGQVINVDGGLTVRPPTIDVEKLNQVFMQAD